MRNDVADWPEACQKIAEKLQSFPLRDSYTHEERELQPHMEEVIEGLLPCEHKIIRCQGGKREPRPHIKAFDTDFWPDITIHRNDDSPVLAIEAKLVKNEGSLPPALADGIGKSIIYRVKYPFVLLFVLHGGKRKLHCNEFDEEIQANLLDNKICLVLRKTAINY